jgi:hypothetical protein
MKFFSALVMIGVTSTGAILGMSDTNRRLCFTLLLKSDYIAKGFYANNTGKNLFESLGKNIFDIIVCMPEGKERIIGAFKQADEQDKLVKISYLERPDRQRLATIVPIIKKEKNSSSEKKNFLVTIEYLDYQYKSFL